MNEQQFSDVQLPLTFKAKELFIIAYLLKGGQAATMFPLIYKIKMAVSEATQSEDDVPVTATIDQIYNVVNLLGMQPEAIMASTNRNIKLSLVSQLDVLKQSADADIAGAAQSISDLVSSITDNNQQRVANGINEGKDFILKV